MSFFIEADRGTVRKLKLNFVDLPLDVRNGGVEIATDDLNIVAGLIASCAYEYDEGYLVRNALKNWQDRHNAAWSRQAEKILREMFAEHGREAEKYVYLDLLRILCGKNSLNMYGYVRFGAVNLKRYYQSVANRVLRNLKQKEEEEAFIRALKLLVKAQTPQIEQVRVCLKADGDFDIFDASGADLKADYLAEVDLAVWQKAQAEDRLMSILLNLAPSEVIIEREDRGQWELKLVREVFCERLKPKNS